MNENKIKKTVTLDPQIIDAIRLEAEYRNLPFSRILNRNLTLFYAYLFDGEELLDDVTEGQKADADV